MKHLLIGCFLIFVCLVGCERSTQEWQGYSEGRYTYISSQFPGVLKKLYVLRGAYVHQGQPLLVLEPQPESDQLRQAEADVKVAEANKISSVAAFNFSKITLQRNTELFHKNALQKSEVDRAQTEFDKDKAAIDQMEANLLSAKAALIKAQWTAGQKTFVAPKDGLIFDTYFRQGELIPIDQAIVSLLAPQDMKVIFYASERELGHLKLGQKVRVTCDGCQRAIHANISFISPQAEYTPPVIYSNEARSKLVFRIEAEPSVKDALLLHPGQPVSIFLIKTVRFFKKEKTGPAPLLPQVEKDHGGG